MIRVLGFALALTFAGPAAAGPLLARDTAEVRKEGSWSVGVFNPLRYSLTDQIEVQTHPVTFLVSPNAIVRMAHGEAAGFWFTGEYGLSFPGPAMNLTRGYLFPTWDKSENEVGWFLVPRAGIVASRGDLASRVLTLRADVAVGVPLTRSDITASSSFSPIDLLFAPVTTGVRARVGGTYDWGLTERLRVRGGADLWLHGPNPSPVTLALNVGGDLRLGEASRFTLGVIWFNANTHALDPETHEQVRSNDFVPTLDFIWEG